MQPEASNVGAASSFVDRRAAELLHDRHTEVAQWTDRLFARMIVVQWLAVVAAATWLSLFAQTGVTSETHGYGWAAMGIGGAAGVLALLWTTLRPGSVASRHMTAAAQMLVCSVLIQWNGGRSEAHFCIFASLAVLALYRDAQVLLTASAVLALDTLLRGWLWPESLFGLGALSAWRFLELAAWIACQVAMSLIACRQLQRELKQEALQRALLEGANQDTAREVARRTAECDQGRKRLEQSEHRVRLAVEAAPNGMIMVNQEGLITLVNSKIEEMFGYARRELLGQPIEILVPVPHCSEHPELRREYFRNPRIRPMGGGRDLTGIRKDGSVFPVELGLNPIQTDEGWVVLAAVVDITQRKQIEARIQQNLAELERKNRELDEFTYVASHDLQEPIRKLVSFSKLLKQDLGEDLNEQAERDLEFIVDAAQRMRNLIQDLLALSRAGRSAMQSEPVPLQDCVRRACESLEMRIAETGARITSDPLPTVQGDATVLTQLYYNLIANALKFINRDRIPEIHLTAERAAHAWTLGVKDNGIGIKPEYSLRIFSPFQRLHNRGEYEGTGIGLSICQKNVERHGGRIWVESTFGEGAHFRFTIPISTAESTCPAVFMITGDEQISQPSFS